MPSHEIPTEPTFTPTSLANQPRPEGPTLADALNALGQGSFRAHDLRGLSDLNREDVTELTRRWAELPEETRVRVVLQIHELSEESVELTFGRALRVALEDPSASVRQLAVDALWEDDSNDLCERFLHLVEEDESQDVRAAAAQGLARFADAASSDELDSDLKQRVWTCLFDAAANEREPYLVRRRALEAVAVFGSRPEIFELIRDAYDADDAGYHAGAIYAMGRTLDRRWLDIVVQELESEDAEMRYEAARAAGEIGDVHAIPGLAAAAIDEDPEVRQEAILALGRIGGQGAERALRRIAESASPSDQEAIAEALGEATDEFE